MIWSEQAPLNDVNKLMKVHVLVIGLDWLQKNSVNVSNAVKITGVQNRQSALTP
jgi:hypothetical protein